MSNTSTAQSCSRTSFACARPQTARTRPTGLKSMQQCRTESEGAVELSKELELVKEQRDGALAQLSLARREIAHLKARNEVQRAARVFVRLEDTQNVLADTEHALGRACKALEHTRAQHKAQFSARCRKDERTQMTVRDRLEEMMREREVMNATNSRLRSEIEKLTSQLNKQLEANPPGALPEVRSRIARQEQLLKQQEERCARLHREVEVWKERACNALALERLTALHVGPNSMVPPTDEEAKARRSAEEVEERRRLNAEIAFWKAEALQERERQKSFQQALWASGDFTSHQKQKVVFFLREGLNTKGPHL